MPKNILGQNRSVCKGRKLLVLGMCALFILMAFLPGCHQKNKGITTGSLLEEMTSLTRLTRQPTDVYRTVQFSSYDRRSTAPDKPFWFANEDGFGQEPVPGFEAVLVEADENGKGEYLICDLHGPGAIVRLWTAGIRGEIRLFLDDLSTPVYAGSAEDFFWKTPEVLSGNQIPMDSLQSFRQFDAVYFPIPFANRCRIEWIGNTAELHFYHVGIRLYEPEVKVETFSPESCIKHLQTLRQINRDLQNPRSAYKKTQALEWYIPAKAKKEIYSKKGPSAIEEISIKVAGIHSESLLRQSILSIYFDNSSTPQVLAPLGDFFGSAPGVCPFQSFPFSTDADSTLSCRFIMPFKKSVRIEIANRSGEDLGISGNIRTTRYRWKDKTSMHFYAQWKMDHGLTAQNINEPENEISDIIYLNAEGSGRIVGAAALIYNPSSVPTSWGNWWGEGDEKIFIDRDTFPSFFGTGTEDYFNYSWSSARLFSFAYCGQPRNDGPGNRGYVSNFRWHILDDIPFKERVSFSMELGHHGMVPGFDYGRIVYFYALPGLTKEETGIPDDDLREIIYQYWKPTAYAGSEGYRFIQAEELVREHANLSFEKGNMYAGDCILVWNPKERDERISFKIDSDKAGAPGRIGLTLEHSPESGRLSVLINGELVKFGGKELIDLHAEQYYLDNHFSETVLLHQGTNEMIFLSPEAESNKKIGTDFVWLRIQDQ